MMELSIRLLKIVPEIENLKNSPTDVLSLNFISQNCSLKMENIENSIEKKEFLTLFLKNILEKIKFTLLLNNVSILGIGQFIPCSDIKEYKLIEIHNSTKSKEKMIKVKLETILNNNRNGSKQKSKKNVCNSSTKNIKNNQRIIFNNKNSMNYPQNIGKNPLFKSPFLTNYQTMPSSKNNNSDKNIKSFSLALDFDKSNTNTNSNEAKKYTNIKNSISLKKKNYKTLYTLNKANENCKIKNICNNYIKTEPKNASMSDYYQVEINNKKIEDSILDPNFKKLLLGDEMLSERKDLKKEDMIFLNGNKSQRFSNRLANISYTNEDIFSCFRKKSINSLKNTFNTNKKYYQNFNCPLNSIVRSDDLSKNVENIPNILSRNKHTILNATNDDFEHINQYESVKNDLILFYSNEYLNAINEEMLGLENQLMIDKVLELQSVYIEKFTNISKNFKYYKNSLKFIQKQFYLLNKKAQKLHNEEIKLFFKEKTKNNIYTYENVNKEKESKIWNSIISKINIKKGQNPLRNIFLIICCKNENKLNVLAKKYYHECIKIYKKEHNRMTIEENKECINNNSQMFKYQKNNKTINNVKCRNKIPIFNSNSMKSSKTFMRNMAGRKMNTKLNI